VGIINAVGILPEQPKENQNKRTQNANENIYKKKQKK